MAKRTDKEKLAQDALKASRIQQTLSTNGWNDILEIIGSKFDSLIDEALDKDNPEARGGVNAIKEIMSDIDRDLKFGEAALRRYKAKYVSRE